MNLKNIMLSASKKPDTKGHIVYGSIYMKLSRIGKSTEKADWWLPWIEGPGRIKTA